MGLNGMFFLLLGLVGVISAAERREAWVVDDFEGGELQGWESSYSPEYYRGGYGQEGLSIVEDPERGRVLRAHVVFGDEKGSERIFITKQLPEHPRAYKCARLRFWYKVTTNRLDPRNGLICRLRATNMSFTDYLFGTGPTVVPHQWREVVLDIGRPQRLVNIYGTYFSRLKEITFRIDDEDAANLEFDFFLDHIRLELKEPETVEYTPQILPRLRLRNGVPRALVLRHSAAGYYGVARTLRDWWRVKVGLFRGLHFPIWEFPTTRAELLAYDLVVLADVDPYVLTNEQVEWLADFVASGGGLLFIGGPNTFGYSKDFKKPLADLLPVTFAQDTDDLVAVHAVPQFVEEHFITRGLRELAPVSHIHRLRAKEEAVVLLRAGSKRPVGWGYYSGGNPDNAVVTWSEEAHRGRRSAMIETKSFYRDPQTGEPRFLSVSLMQGETDGYRGPRTYLARPNTTYRFSFWAQGDVPAVEVICQGWKTEAAAPGDRVAVPTSLGRFTPTAGWRRYEGTFTTPAEIRRMALKFHLSGGPGSFPLGTRLYVDDVTLEEVGGEGKNLAVNPGAEIVEEYPVLVAGEFHQGRVVVLNAYPEVAETTENCFFTADFYDDLLRQTVQWLTRREPSVPPTAPAPPPPQAQKREGLKVQVRFPFGKAAFAPGDLLRFAVKVEPSEEAPALETLTVQARLYDFRGTLLHRFAARPAREHLEYQLPLPEWETGDYCLVVEIGSTASPVLVRTEADFSLVNRLRRQDFYPLISWLGTGRGGHLLDEEGLKARVDDLVAHGFNTVAYGGLRYFREWEPLPHRFELLNAVERYAQSKDLAVIYEYENFHHVGRRARTEPCVFAPEYGEDLARRLQGMLAAGAAVPRLLSVKITDEPFANQNNLDYCAHCQRAFRERYGEPLRRREEISEDDLLGRLHFNEFVSAYVRTGYQQSQALKQAAGNPFDLLLTYCSPAYGYGRPDRGLEDALEWSRCADRIDFDVYPYFYPASQVIRMVQVHYCFGLHRHFARFLGRPMGFYVELDDRNYPLQINPKEASAECAYTALGQGADYLNSFIHAAFGTGNDARPERWDHLGRALRQIRNLAPLLNRVDKAVAPIALFFPHTQWFATNRPFALAYAYQLVLRAFGECDFLHEKIARERGMGDLRALLLLETEILPDDLAALIADFVRKGGLLLCDQVPTRNERGEPCRLPPDLFGGEARPFAGELTATIGRYGRGQTVLFSTKLDPAFRDAVEEPQPVVEEALRRAMHDLLFTAGLRPHAWATDPEFEANALVGRNCACLVVINHRPQRARTRVEVYDLGFPVCFLADLVSGTPLSFRSTDEGLTFEVEVPGRGAKLLGLYPARPVEDEIQLAASTFRRGGELTYRVVVRDEQGRPALGHHVLAITVTDAEGTVRTRYGDQVVTEDGVYQRRVRLAENAAPGKWTLRVADRLTGQVREAPFEVE